MIDAFESTARTCPEKVFLTFVDASGREVAYTYRQARLLSASIARYLQQRGVHRGDYVAVDLPNCAEYVFLVLAAAYGSFSLACLNNRLTTIEKSSRLLEFEREGLRVSHRVDQSRVGGLMAAVHAMLRGEGRQGMRSIMGVERDAINDTVHFAERAAHLFDDKSNALVMFTSGTTGKSKAVALSWRQLTESARASNYVLSERARGMWQAVLPLYHIGGFQVLVRSIENRTPMRLYASFSPQRVLKDAARYEITHISVVDKMLQDLLAADEKMALPRYDCILLGGGPVNAQTLENALAAGARVYASYGMTETSSQIANELVVPGFSGGLKLLPGYTARIVDPDDRGFGSLAVRGPGVFSGYLNSKAAFTIDGFFLTGDTASLHAGRIFIRERTSDMFVSGGENVYPAEIVAALQRIPGVKTAHVFGVPDETWGRRPVAIVERCAGVSVSPATLGSSLEPSLSKLYLPKHICLVDEMPRSGIGKIDRIATEALYDNRIEVEHVVLHHIRVPFNQPFVTAKATLRYRDSLLVEVIDHEGRRGFGECVSFATSWYLPETLPQDADVLCDVLGPMVCGTALLHPREATRLFAQDPRARSHPMACAAIETALWDLYGKIVETPLWRLLQKEYARLGGDAALEGIADGGAVRAAAGAVIGLSEPAQAVETARRCVEAGYRRVKMKIAPGVGLEAARAIRARFPNLLITLDANQSFGLGDIDELRAYDDLAIGWIEEPLDVRSASLATGSDPFLRLAGLQRMIKTPICLDESYVSAEDAQRALSYPELCCIAVKVGKFGGIQPALEFIYRAKAAGREVWMGGMYDTGLSRRVHAAFELLPDMVLPGDIGSVSRYFPVDVTIPRYDVERGFVTLNDSLHDNRFAYGLGCDIDLDALTKVLVRSVIVNKGGCREL